MRSSWPAPTVDLNNNYEEEENRYKKSTDELKNMWRIDKSPRATRGSSQSIISSAPTSKSSAAAVTTSRQRRRHRHRMLIAAHHLCRLALDPTRTLRFLSSANLTTGGGPKNRFISCLNDLARYAKSGGGTGRDRFELMTFGQGLLNGARGSSTNVMRRRVASVQQNLAAAAPTAATDGGAVVVRPKVGVILPRSKQQQPQLTSQPTSLRDFGTTTQQSVPASGSGADEAVMVDEATSKPDGAKKRFARTFGRRGLMLRLMDLNFFVLF